MTEETKEQSENTGTPNLQQNNQAPETKTEKANPPTDTNPLLVLESPYGFYDDDDQLHQWSAGQIVDDPEEIALLLERQAPVSERKDG